MSINIINDKMLLKGLKNTNHITNPKNIIILINNL